MTAITIRNDTSKPPTPETTRDTHHPTAPSTRHLLPSPASPIRLASSTPVPLNPDPPTNPSIRTPHTRGFQPTEKTPLCPSPRLAPQTVTGCAPGIENGEQRGDSTYHGHLGKMKCQYASLVESQCATDDGREEAAKGPPMNMQTWKLRWRINVFGQRSSIEANIR